MKFASLPPLVKLAAWIGIIVVLSAIVQSVAWLLGLPFNILNNLGGGRGVLIAIALASLLAIMAADKRPISQFGLFVGPQWKRLWLSGIAVGVSTYSAYIALGILLGVFAFNFETITPGRCAKAGLSAMTVFPLALTQQILFSGYLLSMLRQRYSRLTSVLLTAFLFAAMAKLNSPGSLLQFEGQNLVLGLFFVGAVLAVLRLKTGNIILPTGLLAGWLLVRRLLRKTALLTVVPESSLHWWLSPYGDARQGPVIWLFLGVGIAVCWYLLQRDGEGKVPDHTPALDAEFKKIFPFSHGSGLAPLDVWLRCLWTARFRVGLKYVPKLVAALVVSTVNTVISLPERLLLPILLRNRKVEDPLFVLGVHRSGTTHLHNMLALDPQFCTTRVYHILNPVGCLFSGWLIAPLMGAFMPWKRPMDSVRFHLFAPQEEEFMMNSATCMSPYWGMTFPRCWPEFDRYIDPANLAPRERETWMRHYMLQLRKVTFWKNRRPVLKSPHNTARVGILREMFPEARFIHIYRDPYAVYRSNMHLAREGHVVNQMQDPLDDTSYQSRFLENYRQMEEAFYRDAADLPADQVVEVSFEDLERDPIRQIREIYEILRLPFTLAYQRRLERYLEGLAGYQKNRHQPLPEPVRAEIDAKMGDMLLRWGYHRRDDRDRERRAA